MTNKYVEQYERMKRSYERFRDINQGIEHSKPSVYYEDAIYAFFMHCWHLKDWIKNDQAVRSRIPTIGSDVEQFATNSTAISLCADLCNSLKHLQLTRSSRSGEYPTFGRKLFHYTFNIGLGSSIRLDWQVQRSNQPPIDAFALATDCIAEWDQFLIQKKLK